MARIVVQGKSSPLTGVTTLAEWLEVSLKNSSVRAGLEHKHTIPVSPAIAREALGAKYAPCVYNGTLPVSFFEQGSYISFPISSSVDGTYNESITGERCNECGYETSYSSYDTSKLLQGHPETMYPVSVDRSKAVITKATWDVAAKCLVPSSNDEKTLIIWRKGWTLTKDRAEQLALKSNPGATVIADIDSYVVLLHG